MAVGITSAAQNVGIIIHKGNVKDPGPYEFLDSATQGSEYWRFSGSRSSKPIHRFPPGKARIHYHRPDDNDYSVWPLPIFRYHRSEP
jgi:pullulanase